MQLFKDLSKEEQDEFVSLFYDRFAGRLDTYAIRFEFGERAAYMPSTYKADDPEKKHVEERVDAATKTLGSREFTESVVRGHLAGDFLVGAYAIRSDNKVQWFALDFDGKNGDPYKEATAQATTLLLEAGLSVAIERSQSGNGYHVWGFLDEPVEAFKVRHALKRFIDDTATFDRMFPNQDNISETRPLGNLIALPYSGLRTANGNSVFVKRSGKTGQPEPVADPIKFLKELRLNEASKIETLFQEAGKYEPEREHTVFEGNPEGLSDGYKVVHPVFGCEFVRWARENPSLLTEPLWYALACNLAQLEDGRALFHEISRQDENRYSYAKTDKKYDQALSKNKPHSCEIIRELGGPCECDRRFPGKVYHPFELASLSLANLLESVQLDDEQATTSIEDGLEDAISWLEQVQNDPTLGRGVPFGIRSVDRHFGYRMGEITVLAARNSIGKSALALQMALDAAQQHGLSAKFFSLEMTKRQLWTRLLSPLTGVTQTRMATGTLTADDWKKIRQAKQDIKGVQFVVDDTTAHLDSLIESAGRFVGKQTTKGKKSLIVVDYLQIIPRLPKENEQDQIARSMQVLARFAKIMDCHVVILCQLNRGAEDATNDSRTSDAWLRGSGVIEFVAHNILIVLGEKGPGIVQRTLTIHKQRNGEAGIKLDLDFNQPLMRFDDQGTWGMPAMARRVDDDAPRVDGEQPLSEYDRAVEAGEIQHVGTLTETLFDGME